MELGLFSMPLHKPGASPAEWLQDDVDQIVRLEELGFSEAWIGEHFTNPWEALPTPDLLIATALARTSTIRLGTGVSQLPSHHPAMLANRIAILDHLARGRFMWGIGSGGQPGDSAMFNIDPKKHEHQTVARDVLEQVLALWNDPVPGVYEHPRWTIEIKEPNPSVGIQLHMKPYQRPHPPIATAGIGPKSDMLTLAGQNGWIPMSINFVSLDVLASHWETYSEASIANGYSPRRDEWRISREVLVADTPEEARRFALEGSLTRDWKGFVLPNITAQQLLFGLKGDPDMADADVTPEYLAENVWIVGSVDQVVDKLATLYDHVGGFGKLLVMQHEWDAEGRWDRSMELLATEVLPRLEHRIAQRDSR